MIVNGFDGRKWKTPHSSTVRDRPLSLITVDIIPIAIDETSQETFIFLSAWKVSLSKYRDPCLILLYMYIWRNNEELGGGGVTDARTW